MADIDETIRRVPDLIARVRELDAAATKGPWVASEQDCEPGEWEVADAAQKPVARYTLVKIYESCNIYDGISADNAALIAEYRTAAPLLADECERLRDENERRREELRLAQCPNPRDPEHGGHCATCSGLSVARTRQLHDLEAECERLRERVRELEEALRMCADALDELMGDTDLDDDTSKAFVAHRAARAALDGSK